MRQKLRLRVVYEMDFIKISSCAIILTLAVLAWGPDAAQSECCYANFDGFCEDCVGKDWNHMFCGKGDCNIVGCDCDGGCRRGSCRRKRSVDEVGPGNDGNVTGHDVVRLADTDADGALDAHEVQVFLARNGVASKIDAWRSLDADGDGKLTPHEIDVYS